MRKFAAFIALGIALAFCSPLAAGSAAYRRPSWADVDHDGLDTRAEVLTSQCRFTRLKGHRVAWASCRDFYTGAEIITDSAPQAIQVDHVLPASEAWKRRTWTKKGYAAFFNDVDNLAVTRSKTNAQKSDRMPNEWCPAQRGARMAAAKRFQRIAERYGIPLTPQERSALDLWRAGQCAPGSKVL